MKKIETINLGGTICHIEEDALKLLSQYLTSVKKQIKDPDAAQEVAGDIEARIVELSQEMNRDIISQENLEDIITILGQPEDFTEADAVFADAPTSRSGRILNRFYRSPDDKKIAGICGGLGNYFQVDPLLFRLGFFLTLFVGGFGLVAYLILWLLVPLETMSKEDDSYQSRGSSNGSTHAAHRESALTSMMTWLREAVQISINWIAGIFGKSTQSDPSRIHTNQS